MIKDGPGFSASCPAGRLPSGRPFPAHIRRKAMASAPELLGFSLTPAGVVMDALDEKYTNWDKSIKSKSLRFLLGRVLAKFQTGRISDIQSVKSAANDVAAETKDTPKDVLALMLMVRDIDQETFPAAFKIIHSSDSGLTSGITGSIHQTFVSAAAGAKNVATETAQDLAALGEKALNIGPWYLKPKLIMPLLLVGLGIFYWDKIKAILPSKKPIAYRPNPVRQIGKEKAAAEMFEKFMDLPAKRRRKIEAIDTSELADLGTAIELGYRSKKWTGKQANYLHEFGKGVHMYSTVDGKALIITGGKMQLTPQGIEN